MRTTIPDESVAAGPGTPDATLTDAGHDEAEPIDARRSRRSFVFFGALAAASLLPGSGARAGATEGHASRSTPSRQLDPSMRPARTSRRSRSGSHGRAPARSPRDDGHDAGRDGERATSMGWQGYLNYQLNYTRIDDDAVEAAVAQKWPLMGQTSDVLFSADAGQVQAQLQRVDDLSLGVLAAAAVPAHGRVLDRSLQPGRSTRSATCSSPISAT